jgi:type II secretory pathway component PulM
VIRFWQERTPRERALLAAAAAFVAAAALYGLLLEPGLAARERLAVALPRLRAQLQDMRWQKEEIARLRRQLAGAARPADLREFLQASVARAPFGPAVERLEFPSPDRARLVTGPLAFDAWLEWVEVLQREFGVSVQACRIVAAERPGLARIEATFALAGGAQAR